MGQKGTERVLAEEEEVEEYQGAQGGEGVRKTCPSLHDLVHSLPTVPTITKRNALS